MIRTAAHLGQMPLVLGPSSWGAGIWPFASLLSRRGLPPYHGEWRVVDVKGTVVSEDEVGPFSTPEEALKAATEMAAVRGAGDFPANWSVRVKDSWGARHPMREREMETKGRNWWRHHILHTRKYLEAALAGDMERAVEALQGLWDAAMEWQKITGSWAAGLLMAEHTALAKLLIDGLAKKAGPAWADTAIDALVANVESHTKLFPIEPAEFASLFGEHTKLAGTYSMDLAEGRLEDFERHFAEALRNGDDLGVFTDRVFFGVPSAPYDFLSRQPVSR